MLAVLSLGVVVVFVVRGTVQADGRAIRSAHALMGLGMAGMFWPAGDLVPRAPGALVFGLLGAWFAAVKLRSGGAGVDGPAHVAIGSAAMVLMYLGHRHEDAGTGGPTGHVGHASAVEITGESSALVMAFALLLVGYFIWHAWELVSRRRPMPVPVDAGGRTGVLVRELAIVRAEPAAHVVMSVLMAVMLLGTI